MAMAVLMPVLMPVLMILPMTVPMPMPMPMIVPMIVAVAVRGGISLVGHGIPRWRGSSLCIRMPAPAYQPTFPFPDTSDRAMTRRWTSLVPSPIAISGASR